MKLPNFLGLMLWIAIPLQLFAQQPSTDWRVGVSKADITPTQSVRLSGYGNRSKPTLEVDDRLSARALAFQFRDQQVSLIVSIDAIGLSATLTDRISAQITQQFSVARNQLVLCTTHSHTAPHLEDVLTNLLSTPLSEPERLNMMAYSQSLVDSVVRIAGEAIGRMRPATMEFGTGRADFAVNRRLLKENKWTGFGVTADGPVDRTVRVLRARETNGQTLAIVYQYACHCTSISPDLNRISADWAGLSASKIEQAIRPTSPNCIALPIIGCGADANPNPRNTYQNAMDHASEMATAVQTVCSGTLQPLPPLVSQSFELVALAPERPSRDRLKTMTESNSVVERNFANSMLETLKRKGRLPETYPAPVHVWN
ncbi:MAG: neutral/alkaline non-lysosomal ceramidase N-terminal domain-containing protein, partial [Pirellula sp.]